ncbi:ATPase [Balneolaceae bacterium YR4-1]|uniref:ATPase n=1 Tax=Halalkalibaculum roseum TaxID=2709311 RepID=A0A6M1SQY8_9BACT|nr:restriction endonuclease [Halalkalibaculum roseum]NGP77509.1 ATPase [Halalkalibaculum roseum]
MENIKVTKASGEREPYDESKLRRSMANAGADQKVIDSIVASIRDQLVDGISTRRLYKEAFKMLKNRSDRYAGRYKLKEALLELGPTGYPFERFTAELLKLLGYSTQVGQVIQGNCVSHEIDVLAEKGNEYYIIECKFHNRKDHKCNVKVPLYIQSRFLDVKNEWSSRPGHKNKKHFGWVVTNTRFTRDAIQYANCVGLKLLSWDHPKSRGLKDLISRVSLHPITCLSSMSDEFKQRLLERDIVFCKQLPDSRQLLEQLGMDSNTIKKVLKEATEICNLDNNK